MLGINLLIYSRMKLFMLRAYISWFCSGNRAQKNCQQSQRLCRQSESTL